MHCEQPISKDTLRLPAPQLHLPELETSWRLTAAGSGSASVPAKIAIPTATVVFVLGSIMVL